MAYAVESRRFVDGRAETRIRFRGLRPSTLTANRLLRDRDGGLWIGNGQGRSCTSTTEQTDMFARPTVFPATSVRALFEDREGNIWVATNEGLDRFRELVVAAVSRSRACRTHGPIPFAPRETAASGSAPPDGVTQVEPTAARRTSPASRDGLPDDRVRPMFEDVLERMLDFDAARHQVLRRTTASSLNARMSARVMYAIDRRGCAGDVWIVTSKQGLIRLIGDRRRDRYPGRRWSTTDFATALVADPGRRVLARILRRRHWPFRRRCKSARHTETADGLGDGTHHQSFRLDADGVCGRQPKAA